MSTPLPNPLDGHPEIRYYMYLAQWVVNGILGVIAIVLLAQDKSPQWFVITGLVSNFIWTYAGITAQSNVAPKV